ncbi:hypothetical protein A2483_03920 [Candidatus Peregrinibacteria bacterium RIFOXYC2_FULL_33_13]|nr:MAG: hypothetical protein UR27_C0009G0019 [Candidatus Peregrinibacteria bacterium GW2011_GWA2_33_10]KKP41285.1 MAG: hypothetical protein UR30_C0001G0132 [Candidatus Peregrinibacteria bacterium GW2011_GWC2_33_13]OGJ53787.1 MAG: hypothetical protein A2483_03920 [Candidatus Peregrinibacteria bacterium RIFOXYC2_FULL_33_13]
MKKNPIPLKNYFLIALIAWFFFSAGYIVFNQWIKFQNNVVKKAYDAGASYMVNQMITESEKCKPMKIYNEKNSVDLVSMKCLQQNNETANQPAETAEPSTETPVEN